jgi:hypothetical protein
MTRRKLPLLLCNAALAIACAIAGIARCSSKRSGLLAVEFTYSQNGTRTSLYEGFLTPMTLTHNPELLYVGPAFSMLALRSQRDRQRGMNSPTRPFNGRQALIVCRTAEFSLQRTFPKIRRNS